MSYYGKYGGLYNGDYYGLVVAEVPAGDGTRPTTSTGGPNRFVRARYREEEEVLKRVLRDLEPKQPEAPSEERALELAPIPPTAAEMRAAVLALSPRTPPLPTRLPAAAFDEVAWGLELTALRAAQERDDEEALLLILEAM